MSCGRIVIPAKFRKQLGIEENNNLTLLIIDNSIVLEKGLQVNELGMVSIPLHIRQHLGIEEKQDLSIEIVENKIIISKNIEK